MLVCWRHSYRLKKPFFSLRPFFIALFWNYLIFFNVLIMLCSGSWWSSERERLTDGWSGTRTCLSISPGWFWSCWRTSPPGRRLTSTFYEKASVSWLLATLNPVFTLNLANLFGGIMSQRQVSCWYYGPHERNSFHWCLCHSVQHRTNSPFLKRDSVYWVTNFTGHKTQNQQYPIKNTLQQQGVIVTPENRTR